MLFFGIDAGTTNTKAVVIDQNTRQIAELQLRNKDFCDDKSLPASFWYDNFRFILKQLCTQFPEFKSKEKVCSVATQGGSFILLDKNYAPLTHTLSWTTLSKDEVVADLENRIGKQHYYDITGWQPNGWLVACKLKEIIQNGSLNGEKLGYVSTIADYIYYRLTGRFKTDITNAQITGLCNFRNSSWSSEILEWIGINEENLPKIVAEMKVIDNDVSTDEGKIVLVTSSHDQYAAMFGSTLETDKNILLGTGSAWVLNRKSSKPIYDSQFLVHPGRDFVKDQYGLIATLGPIGIGLEKLLANLNISIKDLDRIESTFIESDTPRNSIDVNFEDGSVVGRLSNTESIRRYMEAAASKVAWLIDKLGLTRQAKLIFMAGGATNSHFWPATIANITGLPVSTVASNKLTAIGAALFARAAVTGDFETKSIIKKCDCKLHTPSSAVCKAYRQWHRDHQVHIWNENLS